MKKIPFLFFLLVGLPGCFGSPTMEPFLAAELLSAKEVEGYKKIMEASKMKGCMRSNGNLAQYGQSGNWQAVRCYGLENDESKSYLEALKGN